MSEAPEAHLASRFRVMQILQDALRAWESAVHPGHWAISDSL